MGEASPGGALKLDAPDQGVETHSVVPRRWRSWAWIVGTVIVVGVLALLGVVTSPPSPDARLQEVSSRYPDAAVGPAEAALQIDHASLREYTTYHGLQVWSGVDASGSPCLILIDAASAASSAPSSAALVAAHCVPPTGELIVDAENHEDDAGFGNRFAADLPDGTIVRFIVDGDAVDAYVYSPEAGNAANVPAAARPDATLRPTGGSADSQLLETVGRVGDGVDTATLRAFEHFLGVEAWVGSGPHGSTCLAAIDRSQGRVDPKGARCFPPGATPIIDIGGWGPTHTLPVEGLGPGDVMRLVLRGDTIDVFLYRAESSR